MFFSNYQCYLVIDDFSISSSIDITLETNPNFPVVFSTFVEQGYNNDDDEIIGGERDMELSVSSGYSNEEFSCDIYEGKYICNSPNSGFAKSILQYDGGDSSMNLNPSGLGGKNFYNSGYALYFVVKSDLSTNITINIYSGSNSSYCTFTYYDTEQYYYFNEYIPFSYFSYIGSGCDFSNVGAVELIVAMPPNINVIISNFRVQSPPSLTPTSSQTPSLTPSQSSTSTPTPAPSTSNTPTPSSSINSQSLGNIIDNFNIDTPTIIIIIPNNPSFPFVQSAFTQSSTSNIMGGERDLQLTVNAGTSNLVFTAGVSSSAFTCASPNEAYGESLLQYDGVDGSMNLNVNGLGGLNFFTIGEAFRLYIESDLPSTVSIYVYSGNSFDYCYTNINTPGDDTDNEYILYFNDFNYSGFGCSFSNVGAIEVYIDMSDNVDVLIDSIEIYTGSATPSSTPTPSNYYFSSGEDIDTFQTEMSPIIVVIPESPSFPIRYYKYSRTYFGDIIGGERDIGLSIYTGSTNKVFSTEVYSGIFSCDSPSGGTGQVKIQWDGYDESMNLNPSGLFGIELEEDGNRFSTIISSDTNTNMIIYVYSGYSSDYCYYNTTIPPSSNEQYDFYFSSFNYNNEGCSFYNVGAIEVVIEMPENLDFDMHSFTVPYNYYWWW